MCNSTASGRCRGRLTLDGHTAGRRGQASRGWSAVRLGCGAKYPPSCAGTAEVGSCVCRHTGTCTGRLADRTVKAVINCRHRTSGAVIARDPQNQPRDKCPAGRGKGPGGGRLRSLRTAVSSSQIETATHTFPRSPRRPRRKKHTRQIMVCPSTYKAYVSMTSLLPARVQRLGGTR